MAPDATVLIRKDSYHDSVLLMRLSRELAARTGAEQAHVVMGTPANLDLLRGLGFPAAELAAAGPDDLVIALAGAATAAADVEREVDALLAAGSAGEAGAAGGGDDVAAGEAAPATLAAAIAAGPDTDLVLISLPGEHAAREARRALALGRHVMLFSDNVPLADEVALKREAARRGLLLMGPDCGTAIVNGMPLGFANVVQRGPIGIVGASGTGIQEVCCVVDRLGGGISQAIGTGGRDLSAEVGGLTTLQAIEALAADADTRVLVVVSKPPAPGVAGRVVAALAAAGRPAVVHFVGAASGDAAGAGSPAKTATAAGAGLVFADTLAGAAEAACRLAGLPAAAAAPERTAAAVVPRLAPRLAPGAHLRGLFCGGTTAVEALVLLERAGIEARSNLHRGPAWDPTAPPAPGHLVLDLGDDLFTRGRPHPMIEPELRNERLAAELAAPDVGLLLFDLVLGYGSHPDPAGVLARGLAEARRAAGRDPVALASVTGTDADPQGAAAQRRTLAAAGIEVLPDNRTAALTAAALLGGRLP